MRKGVGTRSQFEGETARFVVGEEVVSTSEGERLLVVVNRGRDLPADRLVRRRMQREGRRVGSERGTGVDGLSRRNIVDRFVRPGHLLVPVGLPVSVGAVADDEPCIGAQAPQVEGAPQGPRRVAVEIVEQGPGGVGQDQGVVTERELVRGGSGLDPQVRSIQVFDVKPVIGKPGNIRPRSLAAGQLHVDPVDVVAQRGGVHGPDDGDVHAVQRGEGNGHVVPQGLAGQGIRRPDREARQAKLSREHAPSQGDHAFNRFRQAVCEALFAVEG